MKIAVMGAGAIGSLYGGYIAHRTDNEVHLIGRREHIEAISKNGLQVEGLSQNEIIKSIQAHVKARDVGPVDLVLLTVKAPDTKKALEESTELFSSSTYLMCLQNGLGVEEVAEQVLGDKSRIIRGTTTNGALLIKPGVVRHTGLGETVIGGLTSERLPILKVIKQIFDNSGFPTTISNDIMRVIWMKIMVNVGINPLGAITRLRNGYLQEDDLKEIMKQLIEEAAEVARANGIPISPSEALKKTLEVCQKTFNNKNSMLQDIENRKRTEIDYINGSIVRLGKRFNIPTPINHVVTILIKGIERGNN
ncbi:MAG: ketopantoate reductase family protein [Candidatus Helarchaeales archaeon]